MIIITQKIINHQSKRAKVKLNLLWEALKLEEADFRLSSAEWIVRVVSFIDI